MPLPNLAQTAALLAGTALTAAGLNLGVLALDDPEADVTAAASNEQVDLVALPTPVAASIASAQAVPPTPVTVSVAATAVASEQSAGAEPGTDNRSTAAHSSPKPGYEDDEHGDDDDYDDDDDGPEYEDDEDDQSEHEDNDSITTSTMTATTARRPTTEPPVTAAPSPAPTPVTEYLTYEFEGIASIIIARHDGRSLEFWSVISEPGWAYLVEDRLGSTVKIKFRPVNGGDEAEFEAKLENGRMKIKREY